MDEEWDSNSGRRPSMNEFIDRAQRNFAVNMQALEPDPNADPLTQLDQQWIQESVKYTGMQVSRDGSGRPISQERNLKIVIGVFVVMTVFMLGVFFISVTTVNPGMFCFGLVLLLFVAISGWGVRQQLRFAQAKKAYLAQRAELIERLRLKPEATPPAPVVEKLFSDQSYRMSPAAQIRQLQDYYRGLDDLAHYQQSVNAIIARAPEQQQRYLRALAEIEAEWVQQRLKFTRLRIGRKRYHARKPLNIGAMVLIYSLFGLFGIIQYAPRGHWGGLLIWLGMLSLIGCITIYGEQQTQGYRKLEAEFNERRKQLDSRFRD